RHTRWPRDWSSDVCSSDLAVGVYSMAFQFARLPTLLISGPLKYVLYSHLVRIKSDLGALSHALVTLTRLLAVAICPAVGMVAAEIGRASCRERGWGGVGER